MARRRETVLISDFQRAGWTGSEDVHFPDGFAVPDFGYEQRAVIVDAGNPDLVKDVREATDEEVEAGSVGLIAASDQSRAVRALAIVSSVVNVFDATMKSVRSGSTSDDTCGRTAISICGW